MSRVQTAQTATSGPPRAEAAPGERVARSAVSNYLGKLVAIGSGLLLTPFILHQIGPTEFGLWVLVGSVTAYGTLLDLGITNAVIKYVAEFRTRGQPERARQVVATALWLHAGLALLLIALSAGLAPLFPRLFQVPDDERATAVWLVFLAGSAMGLSLPCNLPGAVLRGLHRFDLVNALSVGGILASALASLVVLLLGGGVLGLALVNIAVLLAMPLPSVWLLRRVAPELRFGWRGARRALVRPVVGYSSWIFAADVAGRLQTKSDEVVIGAFLPVAAVTPYAFANKLSEVPQVLANQFLKVLLPLAAERHANQDQPGLRSLYLTSTRLTLAVVTPFACVLACLAAPVLTLWVGATYADAAPLVVILVLASALNTALWPAGSVLQGMARHRPLAFTAIGNGVANLALSILLLPRLGLAGVALGTLIPVVGEAALVLAYATRVLDVRPRELVERVALPALLPAVPMVGLIGLLFGPLGPSSWPAVVLLTSLGLAVYGLAYLSFSACALERGQLTSALRRLAARPRPT